MGNSKPPKVGKSKPPLTSGYNLYNLKDMC